MELERIERFGAEFVAKEKAEKEQKAAAIKGPIELIETGIKTVSTLYTESRAPGVSQLCF